MALDTNSDGAITRAEAEAGRVAVFARLDADGNGSLSEAERQNMRGPLSRGLANADANGDGQISRAEFMAQPYAGFERLDANHDNTVSAEEIEVLRARSGGG
jgi:hypothetical protein